MLCALLSSVSRSAHAEEPRPGEEIVVHGERRGLGTSRRDLTAASTVVTGDRLTAPGQSAADVLRDVPGVRVTRSGASSDLATASIRGSTSAQSPVYLAGVRVNDDVTGTADLSTLPLWMLDRLEVFRGHAPPDAAQLGIGGAIFFEPRMPRGPEIGAGLELGSFGADAEWVAGSVGDGRSGATLAVRRFQADNDFGFVDDTSGTAVSRTRENADALSYDAWAIGRHELGPGARLTAVANVFDREQGTPGLAVIPAEQARTHTRRGLGALSSRVPCGESCVLELSQSVLTSHVQLSDPLRELSTIATTTTSQGDRIVQRARIRVGVNDALEVGSSFIAAVERLSIDQDDAPATRARRIEAQPAVTGVWHAAPALDVTLLGAGQCQSTESVAASDGCDVLEPVGRAGGLLRLGSDWSLRSNVGRYVRVPTLGELYGFSAVVRGNPGLLPEDGVSVDAGVRFEPEPRSIAPLEIWADAFLFGRWAHDLVAFRRSTGGIRPYNVQSARVLGAEMQAAARYRKFVGTELTLTMLDPRDTSGDPGNDYLPFQSRLALGNRTDLTWHLEESALDRASLAAHVQHRASQYADEAGLIVIAAQTTVDFEVVTRWWEDRLALSLAMRNAFDARQFDTVGMPLPGRSVHAQVEGWWR